MIQRPSVNVSAGLQEKYDNVSSLDTVPRNLTALVKTAIIKVSKTAHKLLRT